MAPHPKKDLMILVFTQPFSFLLLSGKKLLGCYAVDTFPLVFILQPTTKQADVVSHSFLYLQLYFYLHLHFISPLHLHFALYFFLFGFVVATFPLVFILQFPTEQAEAESYNNFFLHLQNIIK